MLKKGRDLMITIKSEEEIKKNPIDELKRIYVKFHEESEKDPSLEEIKAIYEKAF